MKPSLLAATALLASLLLILAGNPAEARLDAISAASLSVRVPALTSTTALVEYFKDKYDYGTRTLCYDPAPAAARNNCVTKTASGNQGSFNVAGLKPATAYNFRIEAIDTKDGEKPYNTTGTFTTLDAAGIRGIQVPTGGALPPGIRFDAEGRVLPPGSPARVPAFPLPAGAR